MKITLRAAFPAALLCTLFMLIPSGCRNDIFGALNDTETPAETPAVEAPTGEAAFTLPAGSYDYEQFLGITAPADTEIFYTKDGSEPGCVMAGSETSYTGKIYLAPGTSDTYRAIACYNEAPVGSVASGTYAIAAAAGVNLAYADAALGDDAACTGAHDSPCKSISTAVSKLNTFPAEVRIAEGTYNEDLTISDSVSLSGSYTSGDWSVRNHTDYSTIIRPVNNDWGLSYSSGANSVRISGLDIAGGTIGTNPKRGLNINLCTDVKIQHCRIRGGDSSGGNSNGVYISGGTVSISQCKIYGGSNDLTFGLRILNGAEVQVDSSDLYGGTANLTGYTVNVAFSSKMVLNGSRVYGATATTVNYINIEDTSEVIIKANRLFPDPGGAGAGSYSFGIRTDATDHTIQIYNSIIVADSGSGGNTGVSITGGNSVSIVNNTINGGSAGLSTAISQTGDIAGSVEISNNIIFTTGGSTRYGINYETPGDISRLSHNNIFACPQGLLYDNTPVAIMSLATPFTVGAGEITLKGENNVSVDLIAAGQMSTDADTYGQLVNSPHASVAVGGILTGVTDDITGTGRTASANTSGVSMGAYEYDGAYSIKEDNLNAFAMLYEMESIVNPGEVTRPLTKNKIGSFSTDVGKWMGGVLAPNGKIYCAPYNAEEILVIDTAADPLNVKTISAGLTAGGNNYYGGCLSHDGSRVYFAPSTASEVIYVDTTDDSTHSLSYSNAATEKFHGAVCGPDNKIYFIPYDSAEVLCYDPVSDTFSTVSGVPLITAGGSGWSGGVLGPDGKIYGIPAGSPNVLVIDPAKGMYIQSNAGLGSDTEKWRGATLAANGKIYCAPYNADAVLEITPGFPPSVQTYYFTGDITANEQTFAGAATGMKGYVYFLPAKKENMMFFDPGKPTVYSIESVGTATAGDDWSGAVLAPNGMLYGIPSESEFVLTVNTNPPDTWPEFFHHLSWLNSGD